ncbi:MAG: hypothetical protein JWM44_3310 [Bacilli bacterium]|nr:hypothetical protein [Bacilli bacterium]
MRVIKAGNLVQITFLPYLFPVNCFLVDEGKELTLVDVCLPYSSNGILRTAAQIGKPITRIIITHAHMDHVGALDALKVKLPNAKVYMPKRDAKVLAGDLTLEPDEPQNPIKGAYTKAKTIPDVLLVDGDLVGSLQAVHAPGHTPGLMAFLDVRSRALIASDSIIILGGIAVPGTLKTLFPFPATGTWHKGVSLDSAKKLRKLEPTLLASGHGTMLKNPLQGIDRAIAIAEKAQQKKRS